MKCPYCDGEMVPGTASVKGTVLGFFAIGPSYQHLWFRRLNGIGDVIIRSRGAKGGHQGTQCRAVIIRGRQGTAGMSGAGPLDLPDRTGYDCRRRLARVAWRQCMRRMPSPALRYAVRSPPDRLWLAVCRPFKTTLPHRCGGGTPCRSMCWGNQTVGRK
jgi:hypothetical protein